MIRLASIIAVNEADNVIKVRDLYQPIVFDIPLQNHIHFQSMPVIGDMVLYLNIGDRVFKIIKIWQIAEDPNKRQAEYLLKSGELQLQGIYGQYIYFNNKGNIKFVDSTMLNEFELSLNGFISQLKKFQVTTYDNVVIAVNDVVSIKKVKEIKEDPNDEEKFYDIEITEGTISIDVANGKSKVVIDKTGKIEISADDKITVKGNTLVLDSPNVTIGDGSVHAPCVTGYPNGTFPLCLVTGAPITGSNTLKVKG